MSRSASSGLISTAAVIMLLWGIIYCVATFRLEAAPEGAAPGLLRLESVSKGLLMAWAGLLLFHLPALIRRGEYQAVRMLSLSSFILTLMLLWHLPGIGDRGFLVQATAAVLAVSLLLILAAQVRIRRRLHLPRV